MHRTAWLFGLPSIAAIATSARTAHALGPVDVEVAAKVGGATNPYSGGAVSPMGFGLGGRAGVVLLELLYGGVNLMYYVGSTGPDIGYPSPTATISGHAWMYGVEAGFGVKPIDILTIRPQVGLGNATFNFSRKPGDYDVSNLYVEPGITVLLSLGTWFVGADANALVIPGLAQSNAVFTAHGQVGVKF